MITGDRLETAVSIAKDAGLMQAETDRALTSAQLNSMSDDEVKKISNVIDEMGILVLAEHVDHLFHQVVLFSAVNGDASNFFQEPTEYGFEELLLDHHLELHVVVPIVTKSNEEVRDGGVGCHDAHGVAQIGGGLVDGFPAAQAKPPFSYGFFKSHYRLPNVSTFFRSEIHLVVGLDVECLVEVGHGAEGTVDTGFSG